MARVDPLIGQYLDEYRIERALGQGGMAHVYLALDTRLRRYTALKVIAPSLRTDENYEQRFEREAQAIAQLEHPNIVRVYRFGVAQDMYYMAMQYVTGADVAWLIRDYRKRDATIGLPDVQLVATEIGAALDYAHSQKVIHRDVKPGNIIIDKDGHAVLTDFGLALHADFGTRGDIFGSPHYMSPEQVVSSANAIPQSDFYAFGITLYEMLTGALPFGEGSPMDIAMRHVSDPPPPPSQFNPEISDAVDAVILRCLEKEPEKRFQSGAELGNAFKAALKQARTSLPNKRASRRTIPERVRVYMQESSLPTDSKLSPSDTVPPPPPMPAGPVMLPANFEDVPLSESLHDPLLESWDAPAKPGDKPAIARKPEPMAERTLPMIPLAIVLVVIGVGLLLFVLSRVFSGGQGGAPTPATAIASGGTTAANGTAGGAATPAINPGDGTNVLTTTPDFTPTATFTPTVTYTPSATPFYTPNANMLGLRFRSGSWVALVNTTRFPLNIGALELRRDTDKLPALKAWGRDSLNPGECLRIYRFDEPPKELPNDCKTAIDLIGTKEDRLYWSARGVRIWWSGNYSNLMPQ